MTKKHVPIIGLTGTIAAGKSTVSAWFKERGIPVIDADRLAKEVLSPGSPVLNDLKALFGEEVLLSDGSYNRSFMREKIVKDPEAVGKLNALTHPAILKEVEACSKTLRENTDAPFILYDCPLLYEAGEERRCDATILVTTDETTRIDRLVKRDGLSREEAVKRSRLQLREDEKRAKSAFVIDNSGSLEELSENLDQLYLKISQL